MVGTVLIPVPGNVSASCNDGNAVHWLSAFEGCGMCGCNSKLQSLSKVREVEDPYPSESDESV